MKTQLLILILGFLSSTAFAGQVDPTWNCKANHYYQCEGGSCILESTVSVEFVLNADSAQLSVYSVSIADESPMISSNVEDGKEVVGFVINAKGTNITGNAVSLLAVGQIRDGKKFDALINGTHFMGTCQ
ncbi:MAG: hypothetical protein V4736_12800 [Bdellovibrionota bacterium]